MTVFIEGWEPAVGIDHDELRGWQPLGGGVQYAPKGRKHRVIKVELHEGGSEFGRVLLKAAWLEADDGGGFRALEVPALFEPVREFDLRELHAAITYAREVKAASGFGMAGPAFWSRPHDKLHRLGSGPGFSANDLIRISHFEQDSAQVTELVGQVPGQRGKDLARLISWLAEGAYSLGRVVREQELARDFEDLAVRGVKNRDSASRGAEETNKKRAKSRAREAAHALQVAKEEVARPTTDVPAKTLTQLADNVSAGWKLSGPKPSSRTIRGYLAKAQAKHPWMRKLK